MNEDNENVEPVELSPTRAELIARVRSRGRQIRARRRAGLASITALIVIAIAAPAIAIGSRSSSPQPAAVTKVPGPVVQSPLTVRIELSSDSMVAGSQLAATLVVENTTDKPIDLTTGSCRSSWAITLRRASFVNEPVWTLECTSGPWIVTPGVHRWPSSILASYYHCSGSDQPPPGDVKCPPNSAPGTPPLPVGDYEAVLVTSAPGSLPDAPPVTVHVVDAHSRADLTTRIELPGATFVAGPTVTGTLVVDNNTGKPITLPTDAHGCQLLWRIALTNASIPPNTAFKAECYRPAKPLASGENRFPFTLVTTYITCTSVAGSGGCPPLPPGRYTAVLVSSTGVDPFPAPPPARVKLSAAP